jgi:hypothetical protein
MKRIGNFLDWLNETPDGKLYAMVESAVAATEIEAIDETLPVLFERNDKFFSRVEKRPAQKVSNKAMRVPLELRPGGDFAHFDPDGGDLGLGDGPTYDQATLNVCFLRQAIQWTKKAEWATDDRRKAIIDSVRQLTTKGMAEFRRNLNSLSMTAGTGILGTINTVSTTTITNDTLALDGSSDGFNAKLLRYGIRVNIYDSTLATQRTTGTLPKITFYDLPNKTIRLDQTVSGITTTDKIVVAGVYGATPASLLGLQYHHNGASTGTWLGFTRSTTPEIRANRVAASGSFSVPFARLAMNKVGDRLGEDTKKATYAWMHPCQAQAYEAQGQLVSIIQKTSSEQGLNLYYGDSMQMAGVPVEQDFSQDKTRIDFVNFNNWARSEMYPVKFYQSSDGRRMFELRGASGGVATSDIFYICAAFQMYVRNPAMCVYIDTLTIPSGY